MMLYLPTHFLTNTLKKNDPDALKEYEEVQRERASYKKQLKDCKSKEEVEKLKMTKMGHYMAEAKEITNDPYIPKAKKYELMQKMLKKTSAIEAEQEKFLQSSRYAKLPDEEKEARKKQKTVDVKELRLSPSIDTHDVQVKVKKANEFLKDGDKVKVSIRFRGREIGHSKAGMAILEDFAKQTEEFGVIDKQPKMEGRSLVMFLAPKN